MAKREIKAVVFDIGGVLLDWDPRHLFRKLIADPAELAYFLGQVCTPQWHRAHDLGADIAQSCAELARQRPQHADLIMAWYARGEEMVAGQLDEGVGVLADVKAAGLPCFALSNMEASTYAVRRTRYGFFDMLDGCVISGVERVAKPDRAIFEILLSRYGLETSSTVFVDDHLPNVAAAGELGLVAIQYSSCGQLRRELRRLGLPIALNGAKDGHLVGRPLEAD